MNKPIYENVAKDLEAKIRRGVFRNGERVPSIPALSAEYGISRVTAFKALGALQTSGLIRSIRGKGSFARCVEFAKEEKKTNVEISRVALIADHARRFERDTQYGSLFLSGVREKAAERGLEMTVKLMERNAGETGVAGAALNPAPEEGLIVIAGLLGMNYAFPLLIDPNVRSVFVDSVFPTVPCILKDNDGAVRQLLDFLEGEGCRNLVFCGRLTTFMGMVNENELREAFIRETRRRNLNGEVIVSGDYEDLLREARRPNPPDAFMFSQDDAALKFKRILKKARLDYSFRITGCDDFVIYESGLEELTTVRFDVREMGRVAVETLLEDRRREKWMAPPYLRVPGTLMIREKR